MNSEMKAKRKRKEMLLYRHQPPATPYMYNAEANRKLAWNKTLIRYHRLDDATMFWAHTESFYEFISFQPCSHHLVWEVCVRACVCTRECMLFSFCSFRYKCGVFIVVWLTRKSNHHKKRKYTPNAHQTHLHNEPRNQPTDSSQRQQMSVSF